MDDTTKKYHSALSQCAELLDNMPCLTSILETPRFLAERLASQSQAAQPTVERLSNEEIDIIWATMPGGPAAWLKSFGYQQFAKAIEDEVIINHERAAHIAGTSQAPQSAADLADDDRYQHVRDILLDAMGAADVVNKSRLNMALDLLSDIAVAPKCAARPSQATKAQAKPIAYLRYWARQSWSGNGNHDVDHGDGFEVCKTGEVGDDGAPAFPVYAAPVAKEAPAVLEGWKLVPVEPTPEMLEESRGWLPVGARHHGLNVYRAMLAAASGTGQHHAYLDADEVAAHVEEARKALAEGAQKAPEEVRNQALIEAGALRQYLHNDGSGFVVAYDKDVTDSFIGHIVSQRVRAALKEAQEADDSLEAEIIARRIGLTPENEGGFHAFEYGDDDMFKAKGYGKTPSAAIRALRTSSTDQANADTGSAE